MRGRIMVGWGPLHLGRIDWKQINEEDFNRVVESLLHRVYHRPPQSEVVVIDGRGGDGGLDVAVYFDGKVDQVFQLKYFPEGFSGPWGKSRKPQIKKSFDAAVKNHSPREWTLVMPKNPTVGEHKYVSTLPANNRPRVEIWGRARMDDELARHPDLEGAALYNPLVDTLKQFHGEKAALSGPRDLAQRAAALNQLAQNRSAYWSVDHQVVDGHVTQVLRAKHPNASELEPISVQANLMFGADHSALGKQLQRGLEFGVRSDITLPREVIESLVVEGPEWIRDDGSSPIEKVVVQSLASEQSLPLALLFVDDAGFTVARHEGMVTAKAKGHGGFSFTAGFYGIATLDAELPVTQGRQAQLNMKFNLAGKPVGDAVRALDLWEDFYSENTLHLLLEGHELGRGRTSFQRRRANPALVELVGDLAFLQQKLNSTFAVPTEISQEERIQIRIGRLLLEGHSTWMPVGNVLTATLSGGETPDDLERLLIKGVAFLHEVPTMTLEIQGSKFNLGAALLHHPHVLGTGGRDLLKALSPGDLAGKQITLAPQGSQAISVFLIKDVPDEEEIPEPVAWNIPDIPEYTEQVAQQTLR
ncbi:conserved hypothetical protein [Arthrobacter sp. 9V]|nr:conserved hypothetical protein [Arthrobacter sp. 9V]